MENFNIRRVNPNQVDQLQELTIQTFSEAFSTGNTEENLKKYMEEGFSTDRLTAELSNENSEFYFVELGSRAVGYLKLNFGHAQTELKDDKGLEIERIYVLREFHGKNAGQLLYEKAVQIARQANVEYIWLGVWEENPRAIKFYKKNGFVEFDKHIFKVGNDEQTDILMKLNLSCTN